MRRQLALFVSSALAAALSLTAAAQECPPNGGAGGAAVQECPSDGGPGEPVYGPEYSNGGACAKNRGPAIVTPFELYGVHPPGLDPADANRCWILHRWREMWIPYYAPLSPTSTSARWKPWCYFPLMPYYTPYYCGYCPHRCHNPEPPPYGSDGWGQGPMPTDTPIHPPLGYGVYTSVLKDDTVFWNMGGNGLVPYGTPRPPSRNYPDLVDMIRGSRASGGPCFTPPGDAVMPPVAQLPEPSAETPEQKSSSSSATDDDAKTRRKED
ncbi:MAG TPA: hypothetical protein VH575_21555 [Gemmataceae bacterium]